MINWLPSTLEYTTRYLFLAFYIKSNFCIAPVVKPDGCEPGESHFGPDDTCFCISVDTDEPPTSVTYVLHQFRVHNNIYGRLFIYQQPTWTNLFP